MTLDTLRQQISQFLHFSIPNTPATFATHEVVAEAGYRRLRISYQGDEGDEIPAFLFLPDGDGLFTAVLCHHQHHGQRHWGKSEVAGADWIVQTAAEKCRQFGVPPAIAQKRYEGGHALTQARFDEIMEWVVQLAAS